jgi:hypothetical protein
MSDWQLAVDKQPSPFANLKFGAGGPPVFAFTMDSQGPNPFQTNLCADQGHASDDGCEISVEVDSDLDSDCGRDSRLDGPPQAGPVGVRDAVRYATLQVQAFQQVAEQFKHLVERRAANM